MINIAIVEDEKISADLLAEYISRFSQSEGNEFNVKRFGSAADFLRDYVPYFSVVFMDIQMPGINGMDAAFELRKLDKRISIIFVTSMVHYAQRGYEVDAVSFLVKPVKYYDVFMKLKKALALCVLNEDRRIEVVLANGLRSFSADRLMYVEIVSHRLTYHLVDETFELSGTLAAPEKQLAPYCFLRCNSCYLINPKHVKGVSGMELRIGDTTLRISRPRYKQFMAELADWFTGRNA